MAKHAIARAHWWAMVGGDLLAYLKSTYSPLILLGFDEESGTTAVDSSGNGYDFTWNGSPTLGVSGPFANAGLAAQTAVGAYASLANGPSTGTARTIITAVKFDRTPAGSDALFDARASATAGERTLFYFISNELYIFDGSNRPTGRDYSNNMGVLIGATVNGTALNVYENGIPFKTITGTSGSLASPTYTVGSFFDGTQTQQHDHQLSMVVNSALTDADMHDIAVRTGAAPAEGHYHYTDIVGAGISASCVGSWPFWEEAGSQAIDVSGNEAHGTYIAGPSLGQPPPTSSGLVYSIAGGSGMDVANADLGIDPASGSVTIAMWVKESASGSDGVFGVYDGGTDRFDSNFVSGTLRFDYFDGANLARVSVAGLDDGDWHRLVFRLDQTANEIELWADGVSRGSADSSSVASAAMTSAWRFGRSWIDGSSPTGIAGIQVFNVALTDAQCVALSGG